jgi:ribosome-interacting GTPase 1
MPTNLPPEYFNAEERYKEAATPQEKIARLEELISTVPKHKGTDKLRADLRKRLSKLKASAESKKGVSRHVSAFSIPKEGAGQVAVIGPPNAGKSSLVTALTNASPEISTAPFTTWTPTPGMMEYDHVPIQLIDTPPLHSSYVEPAFMDLLRRCDLLLLLLDLQTDPPADFVDSLTLLANYNIRPMSEKDANDFDPRIRYREFVYAVNKYDDEGDEEVWEIVQDLMEEAPPMVPISAKTGHNLELLGGLIFKRLKLMRVFSKPPNEDPDLTRPFVLEEGSTVEEFAAKVHRDFFDQLKSARIWGSGSFDGQIVSRDQVLRDGDIVELRI